MAEPAKKAIGREARWFSTVVSGHTLTRDQEVERLRRRIRAGVSHDSMRLALSGASRSVVETIRAELQAAGYGELL